MTRELFLYMDKIILTHHISERILSTLKDVDTMLLSEIDEKIIFELDYGDKYGEKIPDYFLH